MSVIKKFEELTYIDKKGFNVIKTPHVIKHSRRYSNFHPTVIKTCD